MFLSQLALVAGPLEVSMRTGLPPPGSRYRQQSMQANCPGGSGRFEVRRTKFWQGGTPHELLVLSDISQPLRQQRKNDPVVVWLLPKNGAPTTGWLRPVSTSEGTPC